MAIKSCTCYHEYQDKEHGKGMRVFNRTRGSARAGSSTKPGFRCTVCSNVVYSSTFTKKVERDV